MNYDAGSPRIIEIRDAFRRYVADDAVADDVLRAVDELLVTISTLPEAQARRTISLVQDLVAELARNIKARAD
jgi:hypothetical protein